MNKSAFSRQVDRAAPKQKRGREYLYLLLYAFVLVATMLVIVNKQRTLYQLGYSVVELRTENADLREAQDHLQAELARITAPDHIVAESMRLGLRPIPAERRFQVNIVIPKTPDSQPPEGESMIASMEVIP